MTSKYVSKSLLTEELFVIAKYWKLPTCPSIGVFPNKLWYIQSMKYYATAQKERGRS